MIDLLKILVILLIIAVLIWRKVDLSLVLIIASAVLTVLFKMKPILVLQASFSAIIDQTTLRLLAIILNIMVLGNFLKETGLMEQMTQTLERLIPDKRLSLVIPPALIGLLPMPGGAMFSAPMVTEASKKLHLNASQKTFFNYWFRHLWEYWWPIYPGLILASVLTKVPLRELMIKQYSFSLVAIAGGMFALLRIPKVISSEKRTTPVFKELSRLAVSIWPVFAIVILVIILKLPLLIVLTSIVVIFLLGTRKSWPDKLQIIKDALSWRMLILLVIIMVFKKLLGASGALDQLPTTFERLHLPSISLIFAVPFLVGFLTGLNQAYIGVTFPLLIPFFGNSPVHVNLVVIAYVGGFMGVLLSPVHLCLTLTKTYFKAEWSHIFRLLVPPVIAIIVAVFCFWIFQK